MYILLKNVHTLVTMDERERIINNVDVLIKDNVIKDIGNNILDKYNELEISKIIDCSNKVVYPGFINTHHHFYQSITRNVPFVQSSKLFDWLTNLYEVWSELDEDFVKVGAQISAGELLLSGCTTSTDHYYIFPNSASNRLFDLEVDTVLDMGMRFYPNRGSMSRGKSEGGLPPDNLVQSSEEILSDCERVIQKYHNSNPYAMCRIILAPCSPFSITEELLCETSKFARKHNVMMHTHLCETIDEETYCIEKMGKRPLQYMEDCNWVGNDVHYAHGIYFTDDEIKLLAKTGTGVSHCPGSNLRLGSGICKVPQMLKAGVKVGLSVDGSSSNDSSNYVREMQLALLVHRLQSADAITPIDVLRIATTGGAKILNTPEIGNIKIGSAADIAIFNLRKLDYAGAMSDPASAIIMCGGGTRTDYTIVNGVIVVENGKLVKINEEEIFDKSIEVTRKMIEKTSKRMGINYYQSNISQKKE